MPERPSLVDNADMTPTATGRSRRTGKDAKPGAAKAVG